MLLAVLLAVSCSSASEGGGTGDQPGDERTGEAPHTAETLPFDPRPSGLDAANADQRNPYGWFEADRSWWGDFGDPFVLRDGDTYVAHGSSTAGRYLPILTSQDLVTWYARSRWTDATPPWEGGPDPLSDTNIPTEIRSSELRLGPPGDIWTHNDGLVAPASWGLDEPRGLWLRRTIWAPSAARIGDAWILYYAVRVSTESDDPQGDGRFCISMATAPTSQGPFRDSSSQPIICDDDPSGSIDPEPFYDPVNRRWHLLWKAGGRVGAYPSALKAVELDGFGRPAPGSTPVTLLETDEAGWEGETIENPSMVHWGGRYHLVYSGNAWRADADGMSRYATGTAICPEGPRAPCQRVDSDPLLASRGEEQGPAGGSLLVGADDRLHLVYAAFTAREDRNPRPRRLRVVELDLDTQGHLRVRPTP